MKVNIKIYKEGGVVCLSKTCAFRKECANHATAGDFRKESGFTPELSMLTSTTAECCTIPENCNQGALVNKNGTLVVIEE